ncbi:hypothetical protein [Arthrobacter sp. Soil736]|uniref:hypothetical protein n=1 Tax=Arthrobacter sp. Soil736 TaxID=1736395 RepID=UPI0012FCB8D5|nr:hypothetical protein [Arthrobacter sp. Soil736]
MTPAVPRALAVTAVSAVMVLAAKLLHSTEDYGHRDDAADDIQDSKHLAGGRLDAVVLGLPGHDESYYSGGEAEQEESDDTENDGRAPVLLSLMLKEECPVCILSPSLSSRRRILTFAGVAHESP